ncbi:MAG: hypothetical protein KAI83_10955 [Thiomargarita sp.]|nr:hypothetical protein [Thiomargarita sp.]
MESNALAFFGVQRFGFFGVQRFSFGRFLEIVFFNCLILTVFLKINSHKSFLI